MSHCVLTEIEDPFSPYPKEALFLNAANDREKVKIRSKIQFYFFTLINFTFFIIQIFLKFKKEINFIFFKDRISIRKKKKFL